MQKLVYLVLLVFFTVSAAYCKPLQNRKENKDSILTALITVVKTNHPTVIGLDKKEEIKFQTFSYLGYIIDADSVATNRLVSVQTFFKNDSIDKKIILYSKDSFLGYYQVEEITPKSVVNYRFLAFNHLTKDINDKPVPVKIDFSGGIPEKFEVGNEVFDLVKFGSVPVKDLIKEQEIGD